MTAQLAPERSAMDAFVLVHRTLTDAGHRLATVLHRTADDDDPAGLARVWSFYRAGLAEHHEGEDDVVFPLVAERDPGFAGLVASMAEDHAHIDALLGGADRAVEIAVSDRSPASRRAAAEAVDALVAALDGHLEREELLVLPRVVTVISADEMAEIERGFLRQIGPSRVATTVASLERTSVREGIPMPPLPLPARLLLPLWRRQYLRLLAAAGIDDPGGAS